MMNGTTKQFGYSIIENNSVLRYSIQKNKEEKHLEAIEQNINQYWRI
jgi:hypothetical protein